MACFLDRLAVRESLESGAERPRLLSRSCLLRRGSARLPQKNYHLSTFSCDCQRAKTGETKSAACWLLKVMPVQIRHRKRVFTGLGG